jgi:hypothetical protein
MGVVRYCISAVGVDSAFLPLAGPRAAAYSVLVV